MAITNISESKPNQAETLSLIAAIEEDFSVVEQVLIKADWVMQNTVQKLSNELVSESQRMILIKQLNAAISSVQSQLYQNEQQTVYTEFNVA